MSRHLIVTDVETNGLDPEKHQAVEVAWWNLTTDERGLFIPQHDVSSVLARADVKALQVSRYVDRLADEQQGSFADVDKLFEQFDGPPRAWVNDPAPPKATLAGSNPRFDARFLAKLPRRPSRDGLKLGEPWHHRLWDLSAYAAGVLGLDELPGLARVCELLNVPPPDHTAEGDVTATGLCFKALMAKAAKA